MSLSAAISSTEEIQKWRPQQQIAGVRGGTANAATTTTAADGKAGCSPALQELSPASRRRSGDYFPSQTQSSLRMASGIGNSSKFVNYYVTLAKEESPKYANSEVENSDSSMYDSFHCLETDICRDSTDDDSDAFSIEEIHTMEVLEYEVASASASEDLYSNDSSSGTEEIFLAAIAANAICPATSFSSDFADTEEDSTGSDDKELSSADYWVCVKCKNKQNNPMFRYCEKCYQIRKTHFPPRPRLRKRRSALKSNSGFSRHHQKPQQACSEDSDYHPAGSKCNEAGGKNNEYKKRRISYNSKSISQSDFETSSGESDSGYLLTGSTGLGKRRRGNATHSTNQSSSAKVPRTANTNSEKEKTEPSVAPSNLPKSKKSPSGESIFSDSDTDLICRSAINSQKDSGFSSALSSQDLELLESSKPSAKKRKADDNENDGNSSDTVCEDLSSEDISQILMCDTSDLFRHSSELPPASCLDPPLPSTVVRSVSDCVDAYSNRAFDNKVVFVNSVPQSNSNLSKYRESSDISTSGNCVTCLTEPKNGVFVHSRFLHLCCCYKCAVKIWNKNKKCPICNCAVKNVMKLFVH